MRRVATGHYNSTSVTHPALPVVLTRSRADNARLAALLRPVPALSWPATRARLLALPGGRAAVQAALGRADVVAFTSRRGVLAARAHAGRLGPLLARARVAAVGEGTAHALGRMGVVPAWTGDGGAAELGDLLVPHVTGRRVLLLRGGEAAEPPADALRRAGALVTDLRLYAQDAPEPRDEAPREVGAVCCASPLAARRTMSAHPWLARFPCVAIGETTARALRELGVADVRVARRPDAVSLRDAILETIGARP